MVNQNKLETILKQAFTLIELLIVVAIIGILAAIAVPNFLNAQTKAKVARVKADMRAIASACEMYKLDHNNFPAKVIQGGFASTWLSHDVNAEMLDLLTTPVAYFSSTRFLDPFKPEDNSANFNNRGYYQYQTWAHPAFEGTSNFHDTMLVFSFGPDRLTSSLDWIFFRIWSDGSTAQEALSYEVRSVNGAGHVNGALVYNPSNGILSRGDIGRAAGDIPAGIPVDLGG